MEAASDSTAEKKEEGERKRATGGRVSGGTYFVSRHPGGAYISVRMHAFLRASRTWCVSGLLGLLLSRASTCVNSVALSSGAFMALAGVQGGLIASRLHQGFAGVLLEACCSK